MRARSATWREKPVAGKREPVTEARLEAALLQCADLVEQFPHTRPIYDRMERELFERRLHSNDPLVRARSLVRREHGTVDAHG